MAINISSIPEVSKASFVELSNISFNEYYEIRGLDQDGKPKKEVLIKAGLADLARKLHG